MAVPFQLPAAPAEFTKEVVHATAAEETVWLFGPPPKRPAAEEEALARPGPDITPFLRSVPVVEPLPPLPSLPEAGDAEPEEPPVAGNKEPKDVGPPGEVVTPPSGLPVPPTDPAPIVTVYVVPGVTVTEATAIPPPPPYWTCPQLRLL